MNSVVHFEIPAKDLDRAKKFYQDLFDWQITPLPEMNYTVVRTVATDENQTPLTPGAINGGMTTDDPVGGPVLVIDVPSIDEHVSKLEAAGATIILPKQKVGEMGYYARFKDLEGNILGLWENVK